MNRLLGKLFSEFPKECWESAVTEQPGDLSSPVSRSFQNCQRIVLAKPKTPSTEHLKNERSVSSGLCHYASQMCASARTVKKCAALKENVQKQEEYERWLQKGRTAVQEDKWKKKPSTPLVLHTEIPPMPLLNSTDPTKSYLPPRVITNPELALKPTVQEALVSITDKTPPSMQKWARQLDGSEQSDWLDDMDLVLGDEDRDIEALQKSLVRKKVEELKPRDESFGKSENRPVGKKPVKVKHERKIDFKSPLQRCIAHHVRMSRRKLKERNRSERIDSDHPKPRDSPDRTPPSESQSVSESNDQLQTFSQKPEQTNYQPTKLKLNRSKSYLSVSPPKFGCIRKDASRLSPPPPKKKPQRQAIRPATSDDQMLSTSFATGFEEAVPIDDPIPVKYSNKTPRLTNSFCQQIVAKIDSQNRPVHSLKMSEEQKAFETNQNNLKIFEEMAQSEVAWAWQHKFKGLLGMGFEEARNAFP